MNRINNQVKRKVLDWCPPGAVVNEAEADPGKDRAASGFYTTAPNPSKVPFIKAKTYEEKKV